MLKKVLSTIGLVLLAALLTGILTAASPVPNVTFTLISGLPDTMNVGDTATVVVQVTSDQPFNSVQMMPDLFFPGRGVVALQGGARAAGGNTATLEITFKAKGSTSGFGGPAPVSVALGVRYPGGYVATQRFDFNVTVP
jgi:hypothetical protein